MSAPKHDQHGRDAGHPRHGHPMSTEELHARRAQRVEHARANTHGERHGHGHLDVPLNQRAHVTAPDYGDEGKAAIFSLLGHMSTEEVWVQFWAQAATEKSHDPPGPARDQLIRHYGTHGFLEERYAREQKRAPKGKP